MTPKQKLRNLLASVEEAIDYFAERADVLDGEGGHSRPNREMQLQNLLEEAIEPFAELESVPESWIESLLRQPERSGICRMPEVKGEGE